MTEGDLEPLRAALAQGGERFSIVADAMPQLIWVTRSDGTALYYNKRWIAYTGLTVDDANRRTAAVRDIVHPDDVPPMWERWSEALATGEPYEVEYRLRNNENGAYRWFVARAEPIRNAHGVVSEWIGTCTDVDERRRSHEALKYIAKASDVLMECFDLRKSLGALTGLLVPGLADFACVLLAAEDGALRLVATAFGESDHARRLQETREDRPFNREAEARELRRLREHRPRLIEDFNVEAGRAQLWPYLANALAPLEPRSSITIPLHARGETFGALYAFSAGSRRYDARDVSLFEEIGRRTSIGIENARSYERERRIAETYQRASLPLSLAVLPGMRVDAVFTAGSDDAEIGGDWYDSTLLPNGSLLVTVGDVMGRGLAAAAIMARIRQIINVCATYENDPARVLDKADHFVREGLPELLITAFIGIISSDGTRMRYASAGHRAPLLRRGGIVEELHANGLPLGTRSPATSASHVADLRDAQLLVLYTDGLVEDREDDAGDCERRLREVTATDAALHAHAPARFIRDACVPRCRRDDIAVLTIRFDCAERWSFTTENAQSANDARADFVRFLRKHSQDSGAIQSAEVVFGELVGNVVRHAPGPVDVELEWKELSPTLHVIDRGSPFERLNRLPSDPLSEGGRGLFLAQHLSTAMSVEHVTGFGNHVAAQLRM